MNVFVPRYGHYLIMTRTELQEPTTMDQLQAMRVFLCAADLASFGLAAQRLGISVALSAEVSACWRHTSM
jgi:hypothetical protein